MAVKGARVLKKVFARRTAAVPRGLLLAAALIGMALTVTAAAASVSPAPGTVPSANGPMKKVIVLMRDRPAELGGRSAARARVVRAEVGPVAQALRSQGAKHLTAGKTLPFVLASVSSAQRAALESNPDVQAVLPDAVIRAPSAAIPAAAEAAAPLTGRSSTASAGPCGTASKPETDPEALGVINAPEAMKLGFDGAGVSVAYIAGPIDTTIPDFKRNATYASSGSPAGSPVLTNVNFSGDPANTPSGDDAGESFLDASSIGAQGNTVFDLNAFVGSTHPLPHPCDITVTGTAPGANVMGLDVFSDKNSTTESNFIQAIQYAVSHGVKVLNESFGSNPFPDTALDATRIADDEAVAAGVTVVTSTGDSGVTSTVGSPATDSLLINAGASTTFRAYKQLTFGGINAPAPKASKGTWLDNNIATISSSGFSQNGDNSVDLVAPGDSNWALCSANITVYTACTTFSGNPASLQFTGGTSESAPLTAGAAADVIQAYQSAHGGASPSPALVKQILMSTATDINAPAEQQGAGLLNIGAAVKEAESAAQRTGSLLLSPNQINITHAPGSATSKQVSITNLGSQTVTVHLSTRTLTKKVASHSGSLCLDPSSKKISCGPPTKRSLRIWSGVREVYVEKTFSVPHTGKKQSRLNFSANYPFTNQASLLHVALYDPSGAYAGYSDPQGDANYANVQVTDPKPGTWTAVFFTQKGNRTSRHGTTGTTGTIKWRADTWIYGSGGTITPASLTIPSGTAQTATFRVKGPKHAGDVAQSIVVKSTYGTTTVPVTVRALVKIAAKGGSFSGLLSGGNGRGNPAQMNTYAFDVPSGKHDVDVSATLSDTKDAAVAYLEDPEGETVASSSNITLGKASLLGAKLVRTHTLEVYKDNPQAGRWTLVIDWLPPVVSGKAFAELSAPFAGKVQFNQVRASSNLPKGKTLHQGQAYSFHVKVKNTAATPEAFFLDPRAPGTTTVALVQENTAVKSDKNMSLPLGSGITYPFYLVPPETTAVETSVTGSAPVTFDIDPLAGDPDLSPALSAPGVTASQSGNTASLSLTASSELAPGLWGLFPSEVGPYSTSGAASVTASASFSAVTQSFDSTVRSKTGDMWGLFNKVGSGNFNPAYLKPGKSATISLTITPTATPGAHVSGTVNLDDAFQVNAVTGYEFGGGDELASLPFSYTVG
jgi:Subtilase family